jgi:FkbM family methyltransferase
VRGINAVAGTVLCINDEVKQQSYKREATVGPIEFWRRLCWGVIYLGPRRDITIDTFNGRLTFDSKDWLIGKYLYVKRSHEAGLMERVFQLLRSEGYLGESPFKKSLLNVGANIGMTAVGLVKQGRFDRAIAFEPTPDSYRLLVHNVNQNGLSGRIQSFPFALSSQNGELELEISRDNSGDNRIRKIQAPGFFAEEKRRTVKIPAKTLDGFFAEHPAVAEDPIGLIWVDIQGHEGHFFRGARQFLSRGIPTVIEFWPYGIRRSGISEQEFCEILSELFSRFYVFGTEPEQESPIGNASSLFKRYAGPREMCTVVLLPDRATGV